MISSHYYQPVTTTGGSEPSRKTTGKRAGRSRSFHSGVFSSKREALLFFLMTVGVLLLVAIGGWFLFGDLILQYQEKEDKARIEKIEREERERRYRAELEDVMRQKDVLISDTVLDTNHNHLQVKPLGDAVRAPLDGKGPAGELHSSTEASPHEEGSSIAVERSLIKLKRAAQHFTEYQKNERVVAARLAALKAVEDEGLRAAMEETNNEDSSGSSGQMSSNWRSREVILRSQNPFILSLKSVFYKSSFRATHLPQVRTKTIHRYRHAIATQYALASRWATQHSVHSSSSEPPLLSTSTNSVASNPNLNQTTANPFMAPLLELLQIRLVQEDPFVAYHLDLVTRRFSRFRQYGGRRSDHFNQRGSPPPSNGNHVQRSNSTSTRHQIDDLHLPLERYLLLLGSLSDSDDSLASPARINSSVAAGYTTKERRRAKTTTAGGDSTSTRRTLQQVPTTTTTTSYTANQHDHTTTVASSEVDGGTTAKKKRQPRFAGNGGMHKGVVMLGKGHNNPRWMNNGTMGTMTRSHGSGGSKARLDATVVSSGSQKNMCPLRLSSDSDAALFSGISRRLLREHGGSYARHSLCENPDKPTPFLRDPFTQQQKAVHISGGGDMHGFDERSDTATMFISLASFKDRFCSQTVMELFRQAIFPSRIFIGIVDQRDNTDIANNYSYSCIPHSFSGMKIHPRFTNVNNKCGREGCPWQYHPTPDSMDFSPLDNIRVRHLFPSQAKGPTFGRFISGLMFHGEAYFMLLDSHSRMTPGFDVQLLEQVWSLPTRGVLSAYPPATMEFKEFVNQVTEGDKNVELFAHRIHQSDGEKHTKEIGGSSSSTRKSSGQNPDVVHPMLNPAILLKSQLQLKKMRKQQSGGINNLKSLPHLFITPQLTTEEAVRSLYTILPDVPWADHSITTTVMCSSHYLSSPQVNHIIRLDGMAMDGSKILWRVGSSFLNGDPTAGEYNSRCGEEDDGDRTAGGARLSEHSGSTGAKTHLVRLQPHTAAGFLFSDSSVLLQVPLDPHLDFMFDGEEVLYSARLFTSGIDSYALTSPACAHHYARHSAPRVWAVPRNNWWIHQGGAHVRYHYMMQTIKGEKEMPLQRDPSTPLEEEQRLFVDKKVLVNSGKQINIVRFGMGGCRSVKDFLRIAGANASAHTVSNSVCAASKQL